MLPPHIPLKIRSQIYTAVGELNSWSIFQMFFGPLFQNIYKQFVSAITLGVILKANFKTMLFDYIHHAVIS